MLSNNKIFQSFIICSLVVAVAITGVQAQTAQPTWWFGLSGAANLNFYDGTTQRLNNSLIVPTAFHKGTGVRPYGSLLMEYRPGRKLGGMLNIGYDGRGGKFDDVIAPCDCPATLNTNSSYLTIEPSLRLGFTKSNFYFFAGPRVAFNLQKDFSYTQLKQPDTDSELSAMGKTVISGQIGAGYDYQISAPTSATKLVLSPFVSFHPYFGQDPRSIESWSITTARAGIALKFGKGKKTSQKETPLAAMRDVAFSVREPKAIESKRAVSETLPLRNSVFFNEGSSEIPNRYVMLTKEQASAFKEEQLQKEQSENMTGRSARQLNVYHNILNILGDRMRSNPGASISMSGASAKGPKEGEAFAESIKNYLVTSFEIDGSRISTDGRTKPLIPSEKPGGTKELVLLRQGDRRVDIRSSSPELLMEVGGGMMKPVQLIATQVDPLDSHIILNVDGAEQVLKSWTINITDEKGKIQNYGPFSRDKESIPGKTILGDSHEGNYKVEMLGLTKDGLSVKKEGSVHLVRHNEMTQKGLRYSILFDFDQPKSVEAYEKFLTVVVAPLVFDNGTVIIHGHSDIIGDAGHNMKLSRERASSTEGVLRKALSDIGKNGIKFEVFGFGSDTDSAPFENELPEERFYNRTVIIDIVSND